MRGQIPTLRLDNSGELNFLCLDPVCTEFPSSSATEIAWDMVLTNNGPTQTLLQFKRLFCQNDDLDDRDLTAIHRIILGLDGRDLRTYIQRRPRSEIDQCDSLGYNALHWATRRGDSENLRTLLESRSDPIARSRNGQTPLHWAVAKGKLLNVDLLLEYGAEVNARSRYGLTPIQMAFVYGQPGTPENLACMKRLIDAGADVNAQNDVGGTTLVFASQFGAALAVELLLRNGGDLNKTTMNGESALTVAVQANQYEIIPLLLAHGANPAHQTLSGRSLLHEAAQWGEETTLRLLASLRIRGVQVEGISSDGKTARDLAADRTDVTEEWHLAFADLLASVDETVDDGIRESTRASPKFSIQLSQIPPIRLSEIIRIIEDGAYEITLWVYQATTQILRLWIPIPSSLVVVLALLWYLFVR